MERKEYYLQDRIYKDGSIKVYCLFEMRQFFGFFEIEELNILWNFNLNFKLVNEMML